MQDREQGPDGQTARSPLSALAVASLVCAAVPCCPVVNLAGVVMAMIALRRIERRGGGLRGARLARVAFAVGIGVGLLSSLGLMQLAVSQQGRNEAAMVAALERAVRAVCTGDRAMVKEAWSSRDGALPTADAIAEVAPAIMDRFGALERADVTSMDMIGGPLSTTMDAAVLLIFQKERATGSARFDVVVVPGSLTPQFRVRQLVIDDPERGDLLLPVPDDR